MKDGWPEREAEELPSILMCFQGLGRPIADKEGSDPNTKTVYSYLQSSPCVHMVSLFLPRGTASIRSNHTFEDNRVATQLSCATDIEY
jgi:hypothetical protein